MLIRAKFFAVTLLSLATLADARSNQGVVFGRVPGITRDGRSTGSTKYTGRADRLEQAGDVTTYSGNVSISFEDASIVLQADHVAYDEKAKELALTGNVRVKLDQ